MASTNTSSPVYLGIDVGTSSVRAVLVSHDPSTILGTATRDITTWTEATSPSRTGDEVFEQSSNNIWTRITEAVRNVCVVTGVSEEQIRGIGFDGTCSLVVVSRDGRPQPVSPPSEHAGSWSEGERNIMLWRDLRAADDAEEINQMNHPALRFTGGSMGAEMILPRIRWLARHMPAAEFDRCQFFLLPDWLTWRATGNKARSHGNLLACGLGYQPTFPQGPARPHQDFYQQSGLDALVQSSFKQLGGLAGTLEAEPVLSAGLPVGQGLSTSAAEELGLVPGTPVGSGLIDGYAGWLGTVGAGGDPKDLASSRHRIAVIAGTSTCLDVQNPQPLEVPGIWGPWDVIFPGLYMSEGGQPAAGALLDHLLQTHPAYPVLANTDHGPHAEVARRLAQLASTRNVRMSELTGHRMLYPDFHGNRAPLGSDRMMGMTTGLHLDASPNELSLWYLAALEGLVLQIRHIMDNLSKAGHSISLIVLSGGSASNELYSQLLANHTNRPVVLPPNSSAAVPLGSAILGRYAADTAQALTEPLMTQAQADLVAKDGAAKLWEIATTMTRAGPVVEPEVDAKERKLLNAKYDVYLDMICSQIRWRDCLEQVE